MNHYSEDLETYRWSVDAVLQRMPQRRRSLAADRTVLKLKITCPSKPIK